MDQSKQNQRYSIFILLTYILTQFIPVLFVFIVAPSNIIYVQIGSFIIGTIFLLFLQSKVKFGFETPFKQDSKTIIIWGILGTALAYAVQIIAALIELYILGITPTSVNTEILIQIIQSYPVFILLVSLLAPIMEEIVFRKVINGILVDKIGWVGGAVISSLLFSFIHLDGHILIYASMGLMFSYLYYKTKNIWTPIIAHALMNTLVVLINFI